MAKLQEIFRKVDDSAPGKASLMENIFFTIAQVATGVEDPRGFNAAEYVKAIIDISKSLLSGRDVTENERSLQLGWESLTSSSSIAQAITRAMVTGDAKGLIAGLRSKKADIKKLTSSLQRKLQDWGDTAKLDTGVGDAEIERSFARQKTQPKLQACRTWGQEL